jgi:hypothetical protein
MKLFGASSFCATENFDFQKLKLIATEKFSFEKQKSFAKHIGKNFKFCQTILFCVRSVK